MVKLYEAITYIGDWQVVPGEVFEREMTREQEAWLLRAGAIRVVELPSALPAPEQEPRQDKKADCAQEETQEEDPAAPAEAATVDCADAVGTKKNARKGKKV